MIVWYYRLWSLRNVDITRKYQSIERSCQNQAQSNDENKLFILSTMKFETQAKTRRSKYTGLYLVYWTKKGKIWTFLRELQGLVNSTRTFGKWNVEVGVLKTDLIELWSLLYFILPTGYDQQFRFSFKKSILIYDLPQTDTALQSVAFVISDKFFYL